MSALAIQTRADPNDSAPAVIPAAGFPANVRTAAAAAEAAGLPNTAAILTACAVQIEGTRAALFAAYAGLEPDGADPLAAQCVIADALELDPAEHDAALETGRAIVAAEAA